MGIIPILPTKKERYRNICALLTGTQCQSQHSKAGLMGSLPVLLPTAERCSGSQHTNSALSARFHLPPLPSSSHWTLGANSLHTWTAPHSFPPDLALWPRPRNMQLDSAPHFLGLSHQSMAPVCLSCSLSFKAY